MTKDGNRVLELNTWLEAMLLRNKLEALIAIGTPFDWTLLRLDPQKRRSPMRTE